MDGEVGQASVLDTVKTSIQTALPNTNHPDIHPCAAFVRLQQPGRQRPRASCSSQHPGSITVVAGHPGESREALKSPVPSDQSVQLGAQPLSSEKNYRQRAWNLVLLGAAKPTPGRLSVFRLCFSPGSRAWPSARAGGDGVITDTVLELSQHITEQGRKSCMRVEDSAIPVYYQNTLPF